MTSISEEHAIPKVPVSGFKDCCASKNIFNAYKEVSVIRQLNKAKFPVYLACSKANNHDCALKIFPYENNKPHQYFENEIRFSNLKHPHVIKTLYVEQERRTKTAKEDKSSVVSYKIMEYAPFGDLFDFVKKNGLMIDEKLVRTYFKQLIEGLEYLHLNGVSHMDIKLENLLIGEGYLLKIADFDLSHIDGDAQIVSRGTKFYRAPELIQSKCKNTKAADIYSAGVVLFTLKTQGILPHAENNLIEGNNFSQLLYYNTTKFWEQHCRLQERDEAFFDQDFKELFLSMTQQDQEKRASIESIKKSKWYNGPCYTSEELKSKMKNILGH